MDVFYARNGYQSRPKCNFSGYKFKVLELDKFRVVSVKIEKIDKTNKNDTENSERN